MTTKIDATELSIEAASVIIAMLPWLNSYNTHPKVKEIITRANAVVDKSATLRLQSGQ